MTLLDFFKKMLRGRKPVSLCLFSGGKDSGMALLEEINSGKDCIALIIKKEMSMQLSDGPEADYKIVSDIAKKLFNVKVIILNTTDGNFRNELSNCIESLIIKKKVSRIVTGDLCHTDGIINFLRDKFSHKYRDVSFYSIGEKYMHENRFNTSLYLSDLLKIFSLRVVSVRLPDFSGIEDKFIGKDLDSSVLECLISNKIDPLGEDGEYQSLITKVKNKCKSLVIFETKVELKSGRGKPVYSYLVEDIVNYEVVNR